MIVSNSGKFEEILVYMKYVSWLVLSLMLHTALLKGQPVTFRVVDQVNLERIAGAEVRVAYAVMGVQGTGTTNDRGEVVFEAKSDTLLVSVSAVGYVSKTWKMARPDKALITVGLDPAGYQLGEVVFTANKFREQKSDIPQEIHIVTAQQIAFRNPQSSADLLAQSGQVFVQKSQMGGGSPILRGFEANKVLLVVDGVRMNNAIFRGGHLQNVITLDPNMLARTEIAMGPGSVMYGSDALGGVMHFYSKNPVLSTTGKTHTEGVGFVRYSSANQEKTGHIDASVGGEKWAMLLSGTVSDFGDLVAGSVRPAQYPDFGKRNVYTQRINGIDSVIQNTNPDRQVQTAYSQADLMAKVLFAPSAKLALTWNVQYSRSSEVPRYDRLSEISGGVPRFSEWYYGPQERLLVSQQTRFYGNGKAFDHLFVTAAYQRIGESRISRRFASNNRQSRFEAVDVGSINLDARKELPGHHELAYGAEVTYNYVASAAYAENITTGARSPLDTRYPDGGSQYYTGAAYFTHRWELNPHWIISSGLRFAAVGLQSRFDSREFFPFLNNEVKQLNMAPSGSVGIVRQGEKGFRIASSVSTGFRAPNVDDIGKVFESAPGKVIVPNPDLGPEYTVTADLSLSKQWGEQRDVSLSAFHTWDFNALVVRPAQWLGSDSLVYDGVNSAITSLANADRARIVGFTASGSWTAGDAWVFGGSFTGTRGQLLTDGTPLSHIPPAFGRVFVRVKGAKWQVEAYSMFAGQKKGNRYGTDGEDNIQYATPEGMPGWWTANLRSAWQFNPHLNLQASCENLLDHHYRYFSSGVSAPGRNLILALRANF